jgi:hypothetical protein
MLIMCVECGEYHYTEESPLWFHCADCWKEILKEAEKKFYEKLEG